MHLSALRLISDFSSVTATVLKVNWTGDVNVTDLALGKLPVLQVPTQVQPPIFYLVSYQDQNVSVSFNIV